MNEEPLNVVLGNRRENDFVLHLITRLLTSMGLSDQVQPPESDRGDTHIYKVKQGNVECWIHLRQPRYGFTFKIVLMFADSASNRYTLFHDYTGVWRVSVYMAGKNSRCEEFMRTLPDRFHSSFGVDCDIAEHDAIFVMIKMFERLKAEY